MTLKALEEIKARNDSQDCCHFNEDIPRLVAAMEEAMEHVKSIEARNRINSILEGKQ